jgi:nucleotide-binding universal stress UspA family protein
VRILLAVDGSEASVRAAAKLAAMLGWYKETPEIDVLTVHLPVPKFGRMSSVITHEMVEGHYAEESAAALAPAQAVLDAAGVKYNARRAVGQIAETIVAEAKARNADLIFMGTRGMTAMSNMVMGSVTTKVVHLSTIPVVLVH